MQKCLRKNVCSGTQWALLWGQPLERFLIDGRSSLRPFRAFVMLFRAEIQIGTCLMLANMATGFCLLVGCLTSQQQASVSQGRICSDNYTCCHTEIEVANQTFYLTQSQYTDTGPISPSADPITPGAWQGSHWSDNF